jgi:hypothetical protein
MVQAGRVHAKHSMLSNPEYGIYRMDNNHFLQPPQKKIRPTANYNTTFRLLIYENLVRPVLRILEVYPESRILIFSHPGSRFQKQQKREG